MSQIKQLLLLHQQGKGYKTIARTLGMSKNTVKSYLHKFNALQQPSDQLQQLLQLEAPVLEAKFHPGNPAYKDERHEDFKARLSYFLSELKRVGVSKKVLWQEYKQQQPQGYCYSQFCFHLAQQRQAARPSMVLQHEPGEKLFIDFAGKTLSYVDQQTGELIACQVFVACLPYSDYSFAMAVKNQTLEEFIHALTCCLQQLGGVPRALVPDNLKAAVIRAHRYEPQLNRALEDFANHYQTTLLPARAHKPKDKALVENHVRLLYSRVYAQLRNTTFFDLGSLNKAIAEKVRAHNQTRMQQKPYCRLERFLSQEQPKLLPLPAEKFELKYYTELTVAKNNHLYLSEDKHYYSVPFQLMGQKVKVIYTRTLVYIYHQATQVAVHLRSYAPGSYTTDRNHLCSAHRHYLDRSPEYYLRLAAGKSTLLQQLFSRLFGQDKHPEQLYKTCEGLLSLERKTELIRFEKACQLALEHECYSYGFVKKLLENNMIDQPPVSLEHKALPGHNNIRGKQHYQQLEINYRPL